ncbi:MAG: BrnA antitoxin family protein [Gammaproteobacteria bacterium]|nr:BrnA antitoxin family protein [Gammaproteobacteria bacterium]
MKPEYNLKKMEVKRRGVLPALQAEKIAGNKIRITISLDKEVIDYFKNESSHPGALPYQTQINQMLRQLIENRQSKSEINELKSELLSDKVFIRALAKEIMQRHSQK